jgi:diguanylate cyclase (GGDEF)-like protein
LAVQILRLLILPVALLASCGLLLAPLVQLPLLYQELLAYFPYLLALLMIILGWGFNLSRVTFATLNLICVYGLIQTGLQSSLERPETYLLFMALTLLFPLNQVLIALYGERGLLTRWGLFRLSILLASYAALFVIWKYGTLSIWLVEPPLLLGEQVLSGYFVSLGGVVALVAALLVNLLVLGLRRSHADAALLGSTVAVTITFLWFDVSFISALYGSAALILLGLAVIQNSYTMAFLDELTGLPSRRSLEHRLKTLGRNYSIAMLDIDHFKKVNDNYGHDVGDQVLKMVASRLKQVSGGKVYRYGGEEFTAVFPGKGEESVLPLLEELRESVANYPMQVRSPERPEETKDGRKMRSDSSGLQTIQVTISIGLSEKNSFLPDPQAVVKQADQALYNAKRNGRNRTVPAHIDKPKQKQGPRSSKFDYV